MRGAERAYGCMNYISPYFDMYATRVESHVPICVSNIIICVRPEQCMGYGHRGACFVCETCQACRGCRGVGSCSPLRSYRCVAFGPVTPRNPDPGPGSI
eukprot:3595586-Prymnesium_polylepis.1